MGAYLSQPNLYKESVDGEDARISFGASSMQGWRLSQEDAHNSIVDFDLDTNTSFFAVYDGHGGPEVAAYCSKYMPAFLRKLKEYEESNLEESLKKLFLKFDELLLSQEAQKELKELRDQIENNASASLKKKNDEEDIDEGDGSDSGDAEKNSKKMKNENQDDDADEEDDQNIEDDNEDENVAKLYDEATMPLEEVLKRYSNTENKVKKALKKKGLLKQTVGHPSPMIVAAGSSGSNSKQRKKQHLATSFDDLESNNERSKMERKPLDFQKQEEEDISEIKKNGGLLNELGESVNSTVQNHEQDYDEASNLCDLTDSHKSIVNASNTNTQDHEDGLKQEINSKKSLETLQITMSNAQTFSSSISDNSISNHTSTATTTSTSVYNTANITPNKIKLNKEELKLSPIRKKSVSSSSLLDDLSSTTQATADTTVSNGTNNATPTNNSNNNNNNNNNNSKSFTSEENKENDIVCSTASNQKLEENGCVIATELSGVESKQDTKIEDQTQIDETKKNKNLTKKKTGFKTTAKQQIERFIASWVNQKNTPGKFNKKNVKNLAKISNTLIKSKGLENDKTAEKANDDEKSEEIEENDEDDEEDDDDEDSEDEELDLDDDETDEENEDDEDEDDEDDDDDDDEEEDDDYEEDEEEEDEEDADIDPNQGMETRPGLDSGCTAVIALLRDNKHLYVANAGDSRCVVCREGKAIDMSIDHKPEDEEERTRIEKAGGQVTKDGRVNNGLNLSRAIGDHAYKTNKDLPLEEQMITSYPDVRYLEIDSKKDSFMVLACDGIWNFMSSQEVCDYVQERLEANNGYSKLSQICEELFMHCLAPDSDGDGTGCDNMTCIITTFNPLKRVEVKFNHSQICNEIQVDKSNLKRTLLDSNNGTTYDDTDVNAKTNGLNFNLKKLKSEEN